MPVIFDLINTSQYLLIYYFYITVATASPVNRPRWVYYNFLHQVFLGSNQYLMWVVIDELMKKILPFQVQFSDKMMKFDCDLHI